MLMNIGASTNGIQVLSGCKACEIEAHRDVVGALNIGAVHKGGHVNGAMAHPLEACVKV